MRKQLCGARAVATKVAGALIHAAKEFGRILQP